MGGLAARPASRTVNLRLRRWLPLAHLLLGVGLILLVAAINLPWGQTGDGTLLYPQSFAIPMISTSFPDFMAQVANGIVMSALALSLILAVMNYLLTGVNRLTAPVGWAGCATVFLMPVMALLVLTLLTVDISAVAFSQFDPLAGLPAAPWQAGFSLNGPHDELGFYAWFAGLTLNAIGGVMQPFVRR